MLCGQEGRFGVALVMRHCRLSGLSTYIRALGQGKGDEHPTYAHSGMVRFTFFTYMMQGQNPLRTVPPRTNRVW